MTIIASKVDPQDPSFQERERAYEGLIDQFNERLEWAMGGGGERMIERHHSRDKLLVRDRIDLLIDPGTAFLELTPLAGWGLYNGELPCAGIVTGIGTVRGTTCMIIANDATVKGGSFFRETVKKHIRAQDIAMENRLPVLYLVDCGGRN